MSGGWPFGCLPNSCLSNSDARAMLAGCEAMEARGAKVSDYEAEFMADMAERLRRSDYRRDNAEPLTINQSNFLRRLYRRMAMNCVENTMEDDAMKAETTTGPDKELRDGIKRKAAIVRHLEAMEQHPRLLELRFHADSGDGHLFSIPLKTRDALNPASPPDERLWLELRERVASALSAYVDALKEELK